MPALLSFLEPLYAFLLNAAPLLSALAFICALLALLLSTLTERRISRLTGGANGSIETSLKDFGNELKELKVFRKELESYLSVAEMRLRGSVQGVGLVRFNPFAGDGSGGNQSFSMSILDEFGSGVVLSGLYARDRVSIYCKPVESGKSTFELTDEERQAIEKARKNIADHKKK